MVESPRWDLRLKYPLTRCRSPVTSFTNWDHWRRILASMNAHNRILAGIAIGREIEGTIFSILDITLSNY